MWRGAELVREREEGKRRGSGEVKEPEEEKHVHL